MTRRRGDWYGRLTTSVTEANGRRQTFRDGMVGGDIGIDRKGEYTTRGVLFCMLQQL